MDENVIRDGLIEHGLIDSFLKAHKGNVTEFFDTLR
jgi:hypothetical protein